MKRAYDLSELFVALNPNALTIEELDEFFVETAAGRDPAAPRRAELAAELAREGNVKILLAGHSGTGKSTELVKFSQEHRERYFSVILSVVGALLDNFDVADLLILIAESIARSFLDRGLGINLDKETIRELHRWFSEMLRYSDGELKNVTPPDGNDTSFAKLTAILGQAKSEIETGTMSIRESMSREQRRLTELLARINLLINEAQLALKKEGFELLIIVEDLDKFAIAQVNHLFVENPGPLAHLSCKAIYTAPLFLFCSPRATELGRQFTHVSIPMLKVFEQDGGPCESGRQLVRKVLNYRCDVPKLIESNALELAIEKTGGVLRHLFNALTKSAFVASNAGRKRITWSDVRYGLNRLKNDLINRISVIGLPNEFADVTVEDLYMRMKLLKDRAGKRAAADKINLILIQAHALVEYNGEGWHRLHPLIEEYVDSL